MGQRRRRQERTILVVEPYPILRRALKRLLTERGFTVIGEAENAHEAVLLADLHTPAVALVDVRLSGLTGHAVARILKLQHPATRLVLLADTVDDDRLSDALRAGVTAYLTKDVDSDRLADVLERVIAGERPLDDALLARPQLASRILGAIHASATPEAEAAAPQPLYPPLSIRELLVLDGVVRGLSNREIADALFISEQTVKNHMSAVLRKLDARDRLQALRCAVLRHWVELVPTPAAA